MCVNINLVVEMVSFDAVAVVELHSQPEWLKL